jgi:hypothetical protein
VGGCIANNAAFQHPLYTLESQPRAEQVHRKLVSLGHLPRCWLSRSVSQYKFACQLSVIGTSWPLALKSGMRQQPLQRCFCRIKICKCRGIYHSFYENLMLYSEEVTSCRCGIFWRMLSGPQVRALLEPPSVVTQMPLLPKEVGDLTYPEER